MYYLCAYARRIAGRVLDGLSYTLSSRLLAYYDVLPIVNGLTDNIFKLGSLIAPLQATQSMALPRNGTKGCILVEPFTPDILCRPR